MLLFTSVNDPLTYTNNLLIVCLGLVRGSSPTKDAGIGQLGIFKSWVEGLAARPLRCGYNSPRVTYPKLHLF